MATADGSEESVKMKTRSTRLLTEKGLDYKLNELRKSRKQFFKDMENIAPNLEVAVQENFYGVDGTQLCVDFKNVLNQFLKINQEIVDSLGTEEEIDSDQECFQEPVNNFSALLEHAENILKSISAKEKSPSSTKSKVSERGANRRSNKQPDIASLMEQNLVLDEDDPSEDNMGRHPAYMPIIRQTWVPANYRAEIVGREQSNRPNDSTETIPGSSKKQSFSAHEANTMENRMLALMESIVQVQRQGNVAREDPEVFGIKDDMQFPTWLGNFEELVEDVYPNPGTRLRKLDKFTEGEANFCIKGFVGLNTNRAYEQAKATLKERFGDQSDVMRELKFRLKTWPDISTDDGGNSLRKYSYVLLQCKIQAEHFGKSLDDDDLNQILASKLPKDMRDRWARRGVEIRLQTCNLPTFSQFCDFINYEVKVATLPVIGTAVMDRFIADRTPRGNNQRWPMPSSANTFAASTQIQGCLCCSNRNTGHVLKDCPKFQSMPYMERVEFVKMNFYCFACLKQGHISKHCDDKAFCDVCNRRHPTLLHVFSPLNGNNIPSCTSTTMSTKVEWKMACPKTTRIMPVLVGTGSTCDGSYIRTYAVLDEQSDSSFISEEIRQQLQLSGSKVNLTLSTMTSTENTTSAKITGVKVTDLGRNCVMDVPVCYGMTDIPVDRSQILRKSSLAPLPLFHFLQDEITEYDPKLHVGILIGTNCMQALEPKEVLYDPQNHCYAIRSPLGWSTVGLPNREVTRTANSVNHVCNKISVANTNKCLVKEEVLEPRDILNCLSQDFFEARSNSSYSEKGASIEDKRFIDICEKEIVQLSNGHFQLPLPFRNTSILLPNNRNLAINRLKSIERKFNHSREFKREYTEFMDNLLKMEYAEIIPKYETPLKGRIWYLPHHGVVHPNKNLRIVFDGSAKYQKISLNQILLSGPDLTNNLVGVLLRFRVGFVAVMGDIEKMFLQVKVCKEDRDFLRFLWWPGGDPSKNVQEYRMSSHLFGAVSSPSCANFVLKHLATRYGSSFGENTIKFLKNNFYVDDGLLSVDCKDEAIRIIKNTQRLCAFGGFNFTKLLSNDRSVLNAFSPNDLAPAFKNIDLVCDSLPTEYALGIQWDVQSDKFIFNVNLPEPEVNNSLTRRSLLSTVCSIFDPLGYVSPITLEGKRIVQQLCRDGCKWDDPISERIKQRWSKWIGILKEVAEFTIPRCIKPTENDFSIITRSELHHFSDASLDFGYGQCSYIRHFNSQGQVHCTLLMAKARVSPLKPVTIPRLELTAALVSARIASAIRKEMQFDHLREFFWTDSKIVLGYIRNESRRFHIYVANRIAEIRSLSSVDQWRYVPTKKNPADLCSRGFSSKNLGSKYQEFINGPTYLNDPNFLVKPDSEQEILMDDPEVKKHCLKTVTLDGNDLVYTTSLRFSSWLKMKRFVAAWTRVKLFLFSAVNQQEFTFENNFSVKELQDAEIYLIKTCQQKAYVSEYSTLKSGGEVALNSKIRDLDPYIDENDIMRVGGRIRRGSFSSEMTHPIIVPKETLLSRALISYYHGIVCHQGRSMTINKIRSSGYWLISCVAAVKRMIFRCVVCRKLRGKTIQPKMADLPIDRVNVDMAGPFSFCGVDVFGPFVVKQGRSDVKRYGVLFTCMQSRAIRIEIAPAMTTSAFLNAMRRFICRNGPVRQLRCDQGSNFVGASNELQRGLQSLDQNNIQGQLLNKEMCDYFPFKFNPPSASNFGGIWERQIRSVRAVLDAILLQHGNQLDDDSLLTFLIEAECTVNSRPLTVENLNAVDSPLPLSPQNIITGKQNIIFPPPGVFESPDLYSRKRWRRVQHLCNVFWTRWRKEYLLLQQQRHKWNGNNKRNVKIGDIVLVVDGPEQRNLWILALVIRVFASDDSVVRKVKLKIASKGDQRPTIMERPVNKIVVLVEKN